MIKYHLGDITDNFSNLLQELKSIEDNFEIIVEKIKLCFQIKLMERIDTMKADLQRCMIILYYSEPPSYSIRMYKVLPTNQFERTYEINLEGNNDFQLIKQDVDDLITGMKRKPHRHSIPF